MNKIYRRGKKVILVDKNLDLKDINQLKSSKIPAFISSDFKLGGESLGQWLNDYFSAESDYKILILKGPRSVETSRNRVSALELSISQEKFDVDGLILDNFTPNDSAELDALLSRSDLSEYDALFCGNDNVAEYLMKKARLGQIKVKDGVVFMGYDGSLKKNLYDYNFVTIDVNPEKQGDLAFSLCKERRKDIQGWKEYITPKRLEYLVE